MPYVHHSDETKAQAIAAFRRDGLARAAAETGVKSDTIRRWAIEAGLDPTVISLEVTERKRRAAQARASQQAEARQQALEQLQIRLLNIATLASAKAQTLLDRAENPEHLQAVTQLLDRSIHKLQLLSGGATERTEADISKLLEAITVVIRDLFQEYLGPEKAAGALGTFAQRLRLIQGGVQVPEQAKRDEREEVA